MAEELIKKKKSGQQNWFGKLEIIFSKFPCVAPLGCQWGVLSQISFSTSSCNSCKAERQCLPVTQQHAQRDRLCRRWPRLGEAAFLPPFNSLLVSMRRKGSLPNLPPPHSSRPTYIHAGTHTHTHTHTHTPYLGGVLEELSQNTDNIAGLRLLPL